MSWYCLNCKKSLNNMGMPRHRAMHLKKGETVRLRDSKGNIWEYAGIHEFPKKKNETGDQVNTMEGTESKTPETKSLPKIILHREDGKIMFVYFQPDEVEVLIMDYDKLNAGEMDEEGKKNLEKYERLADDMNVA